MKIAPAYLEHCKARPDTLIKYLGCHSIRLPLNTCKVYFVVMVNVLPQMKAGARLDMTFDLKGATSNRQRVRGAAVTELLSAARSPSSFKTLLDLDWCDLSVICVSMRACVRACMHVRACVRARVSLESFYAIEIGAIRRVHKRVRAIESARCASASAGHSALRDTRICTSEASYIALKR